MNKLLSTLLFLGCIQITFGQTNISGVINDYASVSNIAGNTITVNSSAAFSQGDIALIIQMKGATIDETNTSAFGDVVNYNNAGNYELVTICDVPSGTELSVSNLQRSYDPSGTVQIVRVPVYDDAVVTSTVTGNSWDGTTGGVVAIQCQGSLTLNGDIDVQGLGFTGAPLLTSSYTCNWALIINDYFVTNGSGHGALKGEGIADFITNKTAGKGTQANGGGGGNDHNSGGGGGGNGGTGGQGGERIPQSLFFCSGQHPGVGGKAQTYSNVENRIFLGGGGGGGHENNSNTGTPGMNGGGIVIIIADTIYGNSNNILANGIDATQAQDGAGGGGAGGTVILDASVYSSTLNVDISGGNGGDVGNGGPSNCNGPGGGGGGGVLWVSQGSAPANINLTNTGGMSGVTTAASQANCTVGSSNSAANGDPGITVTDLNIPTPLPAATGTDVIVECNEYTWIDGTTYTSDTIGATYTYIGGASSGCDSTVTLDLTINQVDTSINQQIDYLIATGTFDSIQWFMDCNDPAMLAGETNDSIYTWNYTGGFFFAVIYSNGCVDTTNCYFQIWESLDENAFSQQIQLYPNPSSDQVQINLGETLYDFEVDLMDMSGRVLQTWKFNVASEIQISPEVSKGSYLLRINAENKTGVKRLFRE